MAPRRRGVAIGLARKAIAQVAARGHSPRDAEADEAYRSMKLFTDAWDNTFRRPHLLRAILSSSLLVRSKMLFDRHRATSSACHRYISVTDDAMGGGEKIFANAK